jgi:L-alanine-DL-glutamate epimerase-like enolase superfamily enzyme
VGHTGLSKAPVKVTALETIQLGEFPNVMWLRVRTDEGLVGLGETFFGANTVAAYVHETVAPYLLGKDPLKIDRHARQLYGYLGFNGTGAEARGTAACSASSHLSKHNASWSPSAASAITFARDGIASPQPPTTG